MCGYVDHDLTIGKRCDTRFLFFRSDICRVTLIWAFSHWSGNMEGPLLCNLPKCGRRGFIEPHSLHRFLVHLLSARSVTANSSWCEQFLSRSVALHPLARWRQLLIVYCWALLYLHSGLVFTFSWCPWHFSPYYYMAPRWRRRHYHTIHYGCCEGFFSVLSQKFARFRFWSDPALSASNILCVWSHVKRHIASERYGTS